MAINKTSRILSIFHLFRYTGGVSFKQITALIPVSEKTVYRDLSLLKRAGRIQISFSKKLKAFVLTDYKFRPPDYPENKTQQRYIQKIVRLCTLMVELETAEDPVLWYREHFPSLSVRTRQRDFGELRKIGYEIRYEWDGPTRLAYQHHCIFPNDTYDLKTFSAADIKNNPLL